MTTRAAPSRIIGSVGRGLRTGVGIGLGSLALPVGIGWFYARVLLDTTIRPLYPERVIAADAGSVTLAPLAWATQPGTWGLRWAGGCALVGPVRDAGPAGVVRPLLAGPPPPVGVRAMLEAAAFEPDPAAVGLAFDEVTVSTPLGPCPAWQVPGADGDTWAVLVHGRGGPRREALRVLPALHRLGLSALVVSYRNDPEAPASPDGRYHLGDTEWLDVEAAMAHAVAAGARRFVLVGWSMGAAIIGALLSRSALADRVAALVWDAPLVDWRATLRQQARIRHLPPALTEITTRVAGRRIGMDFDRFDLRAHPPAVRPPTLLVHTTGDSAVPVQPSRALAAAAPELGWPMTYLEVPHAEHTAAWNADPAAYEDAVTRFLARWLT
jgi:pimeloyl-ACP methyl ester carboxylesterase